MNDDELTERLRRTLEDRAATVRAPDDAWERFQRLAPTPLAGAHRGRWYGAAAGVAAAAAAIVVAVAVTRGSPNHSTRVAIAAAPTSTTPTNAFSASAPTTAAAAASAVPAASGAATATVAPLPAAPAFQPVSVTFVSPSEGWVLGAAACAVAPCRTLRHTVDGGRTWSVAIGPDAGQVDHLRFADATDGWAWGRTELWSTHDGGISWMPVSIPGLSTAWMVEDLEASAGVAHVAVTQDDGTIRLADTPVGSDSWVLAPVRVTLGAGPVPAGQLVLQGSVGWLVQVDRTVVGGARLSGGTWQVWTPPCLTSAGPALLAASSPTDLVAACDIGLWSTPQGEQLYLSHDGGTTWSQASPVPAAHASVLAAAPGAIAVVGAEGGATVLAVTFDEGRTPWTTVDRLPSTATVTDLGFTSATQGVAVVSAQGQPGSLLTTHDGGHTWTTVRFP